METSTKFYAWTLDQAKTYLFALLFITGNVLLPQLCHTLHLGGPTLLPIYFFALIGAYKYGINVGLLTAVLSPLINNAIFGMPSATVLPSILVKSVILAIAAGYVAHRYRNVSIHLLISVVLAYQVIGSLIEWAITENLQIALQDFRIGIPGMLLQLFGGYALLKIIARK